MRQALRIAALLSCAISFDDGFAQNQTVVVDDQVIVHVNGIDDVMTCKVGNTPVLSVTFADKKDVNVTSFLKSGRNKLNCQVSDAQGGTCYGYDFVISGVKPEITRKFGCCNNGSCARSNPVLDEDYTLDFHPAD